MISKIKLAYIRNIIHKSKPGKDGLVSIIAKIRPLRDKDGKYYGYCESNYHRGIVIDDEVCLERSCEKYVKLYLTSKPKNI